MNSINCAKIILTLDVGSSSIRCSAYEYYSDSKASDCRVSAVDDCKCVCKVSCIRPGHGHISLSRSLHPENHQTNSMSLLDDIDNCVNECVEKLRSHYQNASFSIISIGLTTFVMNLIATDINGNPCGEKMTLSYACNRMEVNDVCRQLKSQLGPDVERKLYSRTGAPIHSAYALPQLVNLSESISPEEFKTIKEFSTLGSLYIARLTGKKSIPISYSEASWTGMLNYRTGKWDDMCMGLLPKDVVPLLPKVEDSNTPEFYLGVSYQMKWPEAKDARIHLAVGDGACANIGSKCTTPERIAVTIGTSAAARICLKLSICDDNHDDTDDHLPSDVDVPFGLFCYRINSSTVLVGGALTDGGSVMAWLRNLFNLQQEEQWKNALESVSTSYKHARHANSHTSSYNRSQDELVFVPFLSGERSTGYRSEASGCISGFNLHTHPSDIIREAMEGIVLRVNAIIDLIKMTCKTGTSEWNNSCIIASGNALEHNETWRSMLADCSGLPVVLDNDTSEGTSRGVVIMIAEALKSKSDILPMEELGECIETQTCSESSLYWTKKKQNQDAMITAISSTWNTSK